MMRNPELIRNFWLELTPHRLFITPIAMVAVLYLSYKVGDHSSAAHLALLLYIFFAFIWGTRSASDAICDEVNNNTWDWQRTSQLTPFQMSFGKLFGSTCFAWYGASLALIAYIWIGHAAQFSQLGLKAFILLIGAILSHALALFLSFSFLVKTTKSKVRSFGYFVIALIIGSYITNHAYLLATRVQGTLKWHSFEFSILPFTIISLCLFCLWSLVAVYRSMRLELQYRNIPWVFAAFTLYMMVYLSGFIQYDSLALLNAEPLLSNAPLLLSFVVAVFFTYIGFLSDNITKLRYTNLISAFKHRGMIKTLECLPKWLPPFGLALISGLCYGLTDGFVIEPSQGSQEFIPHFNALDKSYTFRPYILAISMLLLLVRDSLLAHYFQLSTSLKRSTSTIIFYFVMLYFIIPGLFSVLHLSEISACFIPSLGWFPISSTLGPALQVMLIGFLVAKRWKQKKV